MKSSEISFFTNIELEEFNFKALGKSVKISRKVSIYNACSIEIGDFSRIDDFCVLSAGINGICIGKNVHMAVYSCLIGKARIEINDFVNISSRVSIYSSNDDYTGEFMTNPTVDPKYTNVVSAPVFVRRHSIIGSGSVILPGVTLGQGVCIGALSLVNKSCDPFNIYGGVPIKFIKERSRGLEQKLLQKLQDEQGS